MTTIEMRESYSVPALEEWYARHHSTPQPTVKDMLIGSSVWITASVLCLACVGFTVYAIVRAFL
jgi:hypothetical protein